MTFKSTEQPITQEEFNSKMRNINDLAFFNEVEQIVDTELLRHYLFTVELFRKEIEWGKHINESNNEAEWYAFSDMDKALEKVYDNYISIKYPSGK